MSGQSGAGFQEVSDAVNVYDIFQDTNTINDSLRHTLIPLYPQTYNQVLNSANGPNTEYNFNFPTGLVYTDETFYTADAYIIVNAADTDTGANWKAAYNPATAATKVAIQNNINSLFSRCETIHNGSVAEVVMEPGKVALISHLNESEPENRMYGPSDYNYLTRGKVFDVAGGVKYTSAATAALPATLTGLAAGADDSGGTGFATITLKATNATKAAVVAAATTITAAATTIDNISDYDESFEERCKATTSKTGTTYHGFQLSGKLPLGLFRGRRGVATYLHNTQVKLYRNTNDLILENRSGVANTLVHIVLTNITIWAKYLKPTLDILSNIQEGISGKKDDNGNVLVKPQKQKIAFQHIDYNAYTITALHEKFTAQSLLTGNPAAIIVGFQKTGTASVSKRSWNHEDIRSVSVNLNGIPIPENGIIVKDWTNKKDAKRLYELFLMTFGQHQGMPAISFEEFKTNYCLWCFDTSTSITGMLELNKRPTQIDLTVEFLSGTSVAELKMEVFTVRDKLYTIEGPNDLFTEVF